jgi:hypothetical protein
MQSEPYWLCRISRIASLTAFEAELERMVASWAHGRVAECRVIETPSGHGRCRDLRNAV